MTNLPIGTETLLPAHRLFRLTDGVDLWIECTRGAIWISQQDCPRDIVLSAGEGVSLKAPHNALVGALNGAAMVWTDEAAELANAA